MPYPAEHAARMADPSEFDPKSFRRKQLAPGISAVLGRRGEGGPMTVQSYRFAVETFTPVQARTWLGQHKLEPVLFEEAGPKGDGESDGGEGGDGSTGTGVEVEIELTEEAPSQEAEEDGEAGGGETGSTATEQLEPEQEPEQDARTDAVSKSRRTYHIANVLPAVGFRSLIAEEVEPGVLVLAGEPKDARGTRALQGYRFLRSEVSAEDARSWLASHGVNIVLDEAEAERTDAAAQVAQVQVQRFDFAPLMHSVKTPEGYLLSEGYAGRAGVLSYRQDDGSVRRELVPPEELFNVDSLASLARKPVTLGHPMRDGAPVMVSPGNIGEFGVGDVDGEIIEERLGGFVKVRVAVRRQDAVDSVEQGHTRGLSQGYVCDLDETPGTWRGQKYDAVQRNRRYNHLALCALGRAGVDARLHVDSEAMFDVDGPAWPSQQQEENRTMATGTTSIGIEIGGVRYDGLDPSLAQAVAGVTQRAEKAESDLGTARTDAITHKAACDAIKRKLSDTTAAYDAQVAELSKQLTGLQAKMAESEEKKVQGEAEGTIAGGEMHGDSFLKRFDARIRLLGTAKRVGVEKADSMTDEALRLAVVKAHNPDLRVDEADKSYPVAYVAALDAQYARADASQGAAAAAAAGLKPGEAPKPPSVRADEDLKSAKSEYMKAAYGC